MLRTKSGVFCSKEGIWSGVRTKSGYFVLRNSNSGIIMGNIKRRTLEKN